MLLTSVAPALAGFSPIEASPQTQPLIYIADDDSGWTSEIAEVFLRYGYRTQVASSWAELEELLAQEIPAALLLDQHLGKVDTVALLGRVRSRVSIPILVVTGNRSEIDRVIGLEQGADDFLIKPISGRELVARVRANLRKAGGPAPVQAAGPSPSADPSREWKFLPETRSLYSPDGRPVHLTCAEYAVLNALSRSRGEVCSRESLTLEAFNKPFRFGDRSVDNCIVSLRRKIDDESGQCIKSIRGIGYCFVGFTPGR